MTAVQGSRWIQIILDERCILWGNESALNSWLVHTINQWKNVEVIDSWFARSRMHIVKVCKILLFKRGEEQRTVLICRVWQSSTINRQDSPRVNIIFCRKWFRSPEKSLKSRDRSERHHDTPHEINSLSRHQTESEKISIETAKYFHVNEIRNVMIMYDAEFLVDISCCKLIRRPVDFVVLCWQRACVLFCRVHVWSIRRSVSDPLTLR